MRAKSFKKLFVSLALSTVLICSAATSAFAATAQLFPVEEPAVEANSDIPAVDTSNADAASLLPLPLRQVSTRQQLLQTPSPFSGIRLQMLPNTRLMSAISVPVPTNSWDIWKIHAAKLP